MKNITIPDNVKTIGERMFAFSGIKTVNLPKKMTEIPEYMFCNCYKLVSINIPETVTVIKTGAFVDCEKLDITPIMKNKNITEIQRVAFSDIKWKKIAIPSNVKKVGSYAFTYRGSSDDQSNRSIIVEGNSKNFDKEAFGYQGIKVTYKNGIKSARSNIGVTDRRKNKKGNTEVDIRWLEISGASGYQIKLSTDKKFKKM